MSALDDAMADYRLAFDHMLKVRAKIAATEKAAADARADQAPAMDKLLACRNRLTDLVGGWTYDATSDEYLQVVP